MHKHVADGAIGGALMVGCQTCCAASPHPGKGGVKRQAVAMTAWHHAWMRYLLHTSASLQEFASSRPAATQEHEVEGHQNDGRNSNFGSALPSIVCTGGIRARKHAVSKLLVLNLVSMITVRKLSFPVSVLPLDIKRVINEMIVDTVSKVYTVFTVVTFHCIHATIIVINKP